MQPIIRIRGGLPRFLRAIASGKATIGYLGGSITDGRAIHNWPYPVTNYLVDHFPECRFTVYNEAIGATGSDTACLRAPKTIIEKGCDLCFVEYAVNDGDSEARLPSREGLLRMLLAAGIDVVLVYTYSMPMYDAMVKDEMPLSIQTFEALAKLYNISSVWMALRAFREMQRGLMRFEEWLPDGLHPRERGSYCYAQAVHEYLDMALSEPNAEPALQGENLPAPLYSEQWQHLVHIPLSEVETIGPWVVDNLPNSYFMEQGLYTNAVGARLKIRFHGTGLLLLFDFGTFSSDFMLSIDGAEAQKVARPRYDWMGEAGWPLIHSAVEGLPCGEHTCEIEVIHSDVQLSGTRCVLGDIAVLP